MLITFVRLRNYKSYVDATVRFRPGTNAIIGPNGAGKSTLLEAIGFALFNYRASSLASSVREGAESGSVVVGIVSSLDEREYQVERSFTSRATTRYRVLDMELDNVVLVEGTEDVLAWLRQHLGVSPTTALDVLFENAVGVPQGTYTAPFQQPASVRKAVFDPLLQVEEYSAASERLLEAHRLLVERRETAEKEIAREEGLLARLPELQAEHERLTEAVASLKADVKALKRDLDRVGADLEVAEAAEARARQAAQAEERLRVEAATQSRLLLVARQALAAAVAAADVVAAARPGHLAYLDAEEALAVLEARRAERDRLNAQRQENEREAGRLAERAAVLERTIAEIDEAARCMATLAPQVRRQEALEQGVRAAEEAVHQHQMAERQARLAEEERLRAEQDLASCRTRRAQAVALQARLDEYRAQLDQLTEDGCGATEERAAAQAEVERLREQSALLAASDSARCPLCEEELSPAHREGILQRNRETEQALTVRIEELTRAVEARRAAYRKAQGQARQTEGALRSLPDEAEEARLAAALERRAATAAEARAQAAALAGASERLEVLSRELAALGDPRRTYLRCEDQVSRRAAHVAEHDGLGERLTRLASEAEALQSALAAFDGLDDALADAQRARSLNQADHARYLAHQRDAEALPARRQECEDVAEALSAAEQALQVAAEERRAAESAYDAPAHALLRERHASLGRDLATAEAQLAERTARRHAVTDEIKHLKGVQESLEKHRQERARAQHLLEMLQTIRDLLRRAGPFITQQLVRQISREASRLYGDIMGDYSGQLRWSDDYEVLLDVKGRERAFRQLSGGEQMSAALAVRLAALRETSRIDVALFDEPTAHLDPDRRDSLADSIVQVQGLAQLFVISHDDTFERAAGHYVRIIKDEQGSHASDRHPGA